MRKGILFALLIITPWMAQARVYTCEIEGRKVYQSTPCKNADAGSSKRLDNTFEYMTGPAGNSPPSSSRRASSDAIARSREPIDFGSDSFTILVRATAIIESVAVDGRDCEWALKVDEREMVKCTKFLPRVVEGGEYSQAYKAIIGLMDKDPGFAAAHERELLAIKRTMERIAHYSNFAATHLTRR